MYKSKWTCLAWVAAWTFGSNLITRPLMNPDKPLFSWNIPACVLLVLIMWPVCWHLNKLTVRKIDELDRKEAEIKQAIEDLRESSRRRSEAETMRLIDEFLKHPETGVRRDQPKRRTEEN